MRSQLGPLTAFEQTRRSWARVVETAAQLPPGFRGLADSFAGAPFPYAVLTPTYEGFLRRRVERLVWCAEDSVWVAEQARERLSVTAIDIADLDALEIGRILLKSWITFIGVARSGAPVACTLEFNTVTDRLFNPILAAVRGGTPALAEPEGLANLARKNMKMAYFARCNQLAGDTLRSLVLQDMLPRSNPAHLTMLTNRELILIREAPGATRYGAVTSVVPLGGISGVGLEERKPGRLTLSVCLRHGGVIEAVFGPENRAAALDIARLAPEIRISPHETFPNSLDADGAVDIQPSAFGASKD